MSLSKLDKEDDIFIGHKINEARKLAKLNQSDLAYFVNTTKTRISKIEAGIEPASQELIEKVSKVCNKEYDWFFS